jgi:hypothetical protein
MAYSSTLCHLIIATITLFVWVVRLQINCFSGRTLDLYATITTNAMYDALLAVLWTCSSVIQSSEDFSYHQAIRPRPWYLENGCADAWTWTLDGCDVMRASYGTAVFAV